MSVSITMLEAKDIPELADAFIRTVWKTKASYFQKLLAEQNENKLVFLVAHYSGKIAGFLYIRWYSEYPPFAEKNIPEIKDLRVLPEYRRKGIATDLMDEAEKRAFESSPVVGLGVGLYADYGPAQQMYIRRGYVLDGRGMMYDNKPVTPGTNVFVDDELSIYLTKERP
jgi:GNAT superfamily N-acetyltransferase